MNPAPYPDPNSSPNPNPNTKPNQVSRRTREESSVFLLSDAIYLRAFAYLCGATQGTNHYPLTCRYGCTDHLLWLYSPPTTAVLTA